MDEWLKGLLGITAVTSSFILNDGKIHLAHMVTNNNSYWEYKSLGVGNSTIAALANQSGILGNESFFVTANLSYEADYKAVWSQNFSYGNLSSHKFSEAVVCKNTTELSDNSLCRICYDQISLNTSDTLALTIKVAF